MDEDSGDQGQDASRIAELRGSARGWHGVQLAVLGFIGLCGVIREGAGTGEPHWLQVLAGLLVLAAFAIACAATVLVALAAWPVYAPRSPGHGAAGLPGDDGEVARTSRRLRVGITLTYTAVAVLAFAGSSAWWPDEGASEGAAGGSGSGSQERGAVEVTTRAGQVCGGLQSPSGQGVVAVSSGGRVVQVALADVVTLRPVDGC
jgi:hypothetical protein